MFRLVLPLLFLSMPAFAAPLECDIKIEFGSYSVGIDAATYEKMMNEIISNPSVTEKHAEDLGPLGERTLCLTVEDTAETEVYEKLKNMIPPESKVTWTKISSRSGAEFQTGRIMKR